MLRANIRSRGGLEVPGLFVISPRSTRLACVLSLVVLVVVAALFMACLGYYGASPEPRTVLLYNVTFALLVAWFVESDRRLRHIDAPYEHAAFVFFLWPVLLPVYMFRARRWHGVTLAIGVLFASEVPTLVGALAWEAAAWWEA